jgi:O-antigen/teichoic acid export membrane protein
MLGALGGTACALTAVLALDAGINGVFIGALAGSCLALTYGLWATRGSIGTRFSRPELRTMLAYGLPLVPAALSMWALQFVDRVMLSQLGSLADVGQYAVANRVTMVLLLLITAFGTAYLPLMLSLYADDPEMEKEVRGRTLTYVALAFVAAGCGLSLFAHEITDVLAPRFDESYKAVPLLALGTICFGVTSVTMAGISLARRTKFFAFYSGAAAALNIGLNFVLIPAWGMVGAAAATAAAYVALTVAYYRRSQALYYTQYETRKLRRLALLGILYLPLGLVMLDPLWLDLLAKLAVAALFVLLVRALHILERQDVAAMRELVGSRLPWVVARA